MSDAEVEDYSTEQEEEAEDTVEGTWLVDCDAAATPAFVPTYGAETFTEKRQPPIPAKAPAVELCDWDAETPADVTPTKALVAQLKNPILASLRPAPVAAATEPANAATPANETARANTDIVSRPRHQNAVLIGNFSVEELKSGIAVHLLSYDGAQRLECATLILRAALNGAHDIAIATAAGDATANNMLAELGDSVHPTYKTGVAFLSSETPVERSADVATILRTAMRSNADEEVARVPNLDIHTQLQSGSCSTTDAIASVTSSARVATAVLLAEDSTESKRAMCKALLAATRAYCAAILPQSSAAETADSFDMSSMSARLAAFGD